MALTQAQVFEQFLYSQEENIKKALPSHVSEKRFISAAVSYVANAPKVLEADRNTTVQCIMRAAQMGLIIDGIESALVPRKGKCTLMVMVQGLLKLVRNSGELKDIQSAVVYEEDEFDYYTDEQGEHLKHRRNWGNRGNRKLVYALARTKDGGVFVEVMDANQVDAVRKQGYNADNSPWNGPFADEMWRKSAIRRLSKRLPSSTDMESFSQAVHSDDELFNTPDEEPKNEDQSEQTTSSSLANAVVPEPDPEKLKPPELKYETTVGQIVGVQAKEYESNGTKFKRVVADINKIKCGTADEDLAKYVGAAYQFRSKVCITYQVKTNSKGTEYNEIVEIKAAEESPI